MQHITRQILYDKRVLEFFKTSVLI